MLIEWLRKLEGVSHVEAVEFSIGLQTWEGAGYSRDNKYFYCLLGEPPEGDCFRLRGSCDWVLHNITSESWTLTPWLGEKLTCKRTYANIEILGVRNF